LMACLALIAITVAGCGASADSKAPRERGKENLLHGTYRARIVEDGKVKEILVYRAGSFRLVQVEVPKVIVFNRQTGEAWELNTSLRTKRRITGDEAMGKAGSCPFVVMKPYLDLCQFWENGEFRMETADGRKVEATLDGPGNLPTQWTAYKGREILKSYRWTYGGGPDPGEANFSPPKGYIER